MTAFLPPLPICPVEKPDTEKRIARNYANQKNRLILFHFNDHLGFVESLPDYEERKSKLYSRQVSNTTTAVMIGSVGSNPISHNDLEAWFPLDFLHLLGLATGIKVGAEFMEFRDEDGQLIRRIHQKFNHPIFSKGRVVIDETIHHGIGDLLTNSLHSNSFNKSYLRVAIRNTIESGLESLTLEDKLSHVFRALDNLCQEYKVSKTLPLRQSNERLAKAAIKGTKTLIEELARQAEAAGNESDMKVLKKIAGRLSQAQTVKTHYGEDVAKLITMFGFPDPDIMSKHYQKYQ